MTATTAVIDLTRPTVPLRRLVRVEARKMINTRAGRWLVLTIGILTAIIVTAMTLIAIGFDEAFDLTAYFSANSLALSVLVPLLGIMTVTSEWGQRTSLTTFVLEPRRGRVIAAKFIAGLLISLFGLLVVALLSVAAYGLQVAWLGLAADWSVEPRFLIGWTLGLSAGFCLGFAFGMLVPNTAAAIVMFFVFRYVVPQVLFVISLLWELFADVLPWINLSSALDDLTRGGRLATEDWLHLASASWWWIVLPLIIGSALLMRREVK